MSEPKSESRERGVATTTTGSKVVYLARRNPALTRDQFIRRWRRHGALGMSMPFWSNMQRYAQCDVLGEFDGAGGLTRSSFDGIGMLWRRPGPPQSHPSDPESRAAMTRDELETFDDVVPSARLIATERVAWHRADVVAVQVVRLLRWSAPTDVALGAWERQSQTWAASDLPVRHVLDVPVEPAAPTSALRCDAIDSLGFLTTDAATALARSVTLDVIHDAAGAVVATARVLLTGEVVLYERGE